MAKKTSRARSKKSTKAISDSQVISPNKSLKKNLTMQDLQNVRELLAYRQASEASDDFVAPAGTVEIKNLSNPLPSLGFRKLLLIYSNKLKEPEILHLIFPAEPKKIFSMMKNKIFFYWGTTPQKRRS